MGVVLNVLTNLRVSILFLLRVVRDFFSNVDVVHVDVIQHPLRCRFGVLFLWRIGQRLCVLLYFVVRKGADLCGGSDIRLWSRLRYATLFRLFAFSLSLFGRF